MNRAWTKASDSFFFSNNKENVTYKTLVWFTCLYIYIYSDVWFWLGLYYLVCYLRKESSRIFLKKDAGVEVWWQVSNAAFRQKNFSCCSEKHLIHASKKISFYKKSTFPKSCFYILPNTILVSSFERKVYKLFNDHMIFSDISFW